MKRPKFLFFRPFLRQIVWGGDFLSKVYNSPQTQIGEAWLISAYQGHESVCLNPEYENYKLSDLLKKHPELFDNYTGVYPNILKLIDAQQDLSIQIHPDDPQAKLFNSWGKNEFWYILKVENPFIIDYQGDDYEAVKSKIKAKKFENLFNKINLKPEESLFIPAGTIHAIPAKTVVYEIQQASNLTFRIYDYDRKDFNGELRELHIDDALKALKPKQPRKINTPETLDLVHNQYFQLKKIKHTESDKVKKYEFTNFSWLEIVVIEGSGQIDDYQIKMGDALIMTNQSHHFHLQGTLKLIVNQINFLQI